MSILFQCFGITGLIFVCYGMLAFAITRANTPVFWSILGTGAALIAAFLFGFIRDYGKGQSNYKDFLKSKNLKLGLGSIIYTGILFFAIIVAIVLSEKFYNYQKDFTKNRVHTLSEQSVKLAKDLQSPLKMTVFFDERNQAKGLVKDLLQKYGDQSKQVEVSFIDPDKDPLNAQKFNAKDGDIVIEYKGQHHVTREFTEQGITQAILKVNRTSVPQVCFTKGHGEAAIDMPDEEPRSFSFAKQGLANDGFESTSIELTAAIPANCGILVIAGPTQAFTANEAGMVDQYLENGGKSIWMLDPNVSSTKLSDGPISVSDTGLESVAKKWGVKLGKNFLLEKQMQLFAGERVVLNIRAAAYGDHPVVEALKGRQTVFDRVRSVQKDPDFKGIAIELIKSAPEGTSWSQANVDALFRLQKVAFTPGDIQGSVPFAVVSEKDVDVDGQKKKTQLVVFGDSDFASNGMIRSSEFNFDLLLNAASWMTGQEAQVSIRPKAFESSAVELTPQQSNTIFYVAIVILPMLVLTFGMNLWWYRRRKG